MRKINFKQFEIDTLYHLSKKEKAENSILNYLIEQKKKPISYLEMNFVKVTKPEILSIWVPSNINLQ